MFKEFKGKKWSSPWKRSLLKITRDKPHQTREIPNMKIAGSGKAVKLSLIYTLTLFLCRHLLRATVRSRILGKMHSENLSPLLGRLQFVRKTRFTKSNIE